MLKARESKASARAAGGLGVDLNAPEIAAPAQRVLAVVPDHVVGKRPGLVAQKLRVRIREAAKIGERKIGQPPVKGILCHPADAKFAGDVLLKGIKILDAGAAAVEIKSSHVGQLAEAANVTYRNVETAGCGCASDTGKGIGNVCRGCAIVKTEAQVVARAPMPRPGTRSSQGAVYADIQIVAIVESGGDEVKILRIGACAWHIRHRNEV